MKRYYNKELNKWYNEGNTLTARISKGVFSGIPTEEQLKEFGYEEYVAPENEPYTPTEEELKEQQRVQRMAEIQSELRSMDYLTSKYIDGEDMSEYGDWQAKRKALRIEYRELEALSKESSNNNLNV
jgi:hypothetical protein